MGQLCIDRDQRKHPIFEKYGKLFADAVHNGNGKIAAATAVLATLEFDVVRGFSGIRGAIKRAGSYMAFKNMTGKKTRTLFDPTTSRLNRG